MIAVVGLSETGDFLKRIEHYTTLAITRYSSFLDFPPNCGGISGGEYNGLRG